MKKILARKLLNHANSLLWEKLRGSFILVFDDGELETNFKETIYSHYFWSLHQRYPSTPLLVSHHVGHYTKKAPLSSKTHKEIFQKIVWDVYESSTGLGVTLDYLASLVYEINTHMYNELSTRLRPYMVSLDIMDFIDVLLHPKIKESHLLLVDEPKSDDKIRNQKIIDDVSNVLKDVLNSPTDMPRNAVVKAVRSRLVRPDQAYQSLGVRGFLTDADSTIFRYPIMVGWVRGMRKLHDVIIESRSASKSLQFSKTPLQDAEYFSRKLQVLDQTLERLYTGDCGSTHYLHWKVREASGGSEDEAARKGDLHNLVGKYYMDETTGKLAMVNSSDKHLIGKTLKIRSGVAGCMHPDHRGICSTCFGKLSDNVPPRTNIGQAAATSVTEKSSQLVMSVKHFDGSSVVEPILIEQDYQRFIKASKDNGAYLLNDALKGKKVTIIISEDEAVGLTDVTDVKNVQELGLPRISEISYVGIRVEDGDIKEEVAVPVYVSKRLSSMTYPFLEFIKKKGWELNDKGQYLFDFTDWDFNKPLLVLPFRHFNMSDHSAARLGLFISNDELILFELLERLVRPVYYSVTRKSVRECSRNTRVEKISSEDAKDSCEASYA